MKRKSRRYLFLLGALGFLCWRMLLMWPFCVSSDEKALQQRVANALPIGSAWHEVESWLQAEGANVFYIVDNEGKRTGLNGRKSYKTWAGTVGWFDMDFHFDQDGKFTKRDITIDQDYILP